MGIYGNTFRHENNEIQLTESEMKDTLLEIYSDIVESYENEDTEDVVAEGANLDMRAIWKESTKKAKKHINAYKVYMRKKDYSRAIPEIESAKKILVENKSKLEKVKDSDNIGSVVLGYFAWDLYTLFENLLPSLGAGTAISAAQAANAISTKLASSLATTVGNIMTIVSLARDIKALHDSIKENKESFDIKHLNMYRSKLIRYMGDAIKNVEKLEEAAKKAAQESKSEKK